MTKLFSESSRYTAVVSGPTYPQAVRGRRALNEAFLEDRRKNLTRDELRTVAVFVPSLVADLALRDGDYEAFGYDLDDVAVLLVDLSGTCVRQAARQADRHHQPGRQMSQAQARV